MSGNPHFLEESPYKMTKEQESQARLHRRRCTRTDPDMFDTSRTMRCDEWLVIVDHELGVPALFCSFHGWLTFEESKPGA